jgi:hypothetical protein
VEIEIQLLDSTNRYLQNYIDVANQQIGNLKRIDAETVRQLNLGIITTETIEINQQLVNNIYLNKIAQGDYEFSEQDITTLISVATQCPVSGGVAVYLARSLYSVIDPTVEYDDEYICMQGGILLRKSQAKTNASAEVYPNPTSNGATLYYNIGDDGELKIYDAFGQEIKSFGLISKDHELFFNTNNLTNGIYYLKVTSKSEIVSNLKLIITR